MAGGDDEKSSINQFTKAFGKYGEQIVDAFLTNFKAEEITKMVDKMDVAATNVIKQFGATRDRIVDIKSAMGDALTSVTLLGGSFESIQSIQKSIGDTLGRNLVVTSESYDKLFATTQVTGVETGRMVGAFKEAGISAYQSVTEMQKTVDVARSMGVNVTAVSGKVVDNMDALNKFGFQNGVEGLAKMAAQATMLRVDMKSTLNMAERLFDPEQAIDMAAGLQRLGVAQSDLLDPLRLMDLAQNDPAELQNQLSEMSKQFVQLNEKGQFEIMPGARRQLAEIEKQLGLGRGELSKMALSSAEVEDKMKKIKFPGDAFTEEQRMMIANMAEMGAGGEYKIRFEGKDRNLEEMMKIFKEDKEKGGTMMEEFLKTQEPKTMEQLAQDQLDTATFMSKQVEAIANRMGAAVGGMKVTDQAQRAGRELYATIPKVAGGEKLQIKTIREEGGKMAEDLIKAAGKGDLAGALKVGGDLENYLRDAVSQTFDKGKEAFNDLSNSTNPLIKVFGDATKTVSDYVITHEKLNKETLFGKSESKVENRTSEAVKNIETNKPTPPTPVENKNVNEANLNIKIDAPSNMDTDKLIEFFKSNPDIMQTIAVRMKETMNNNGQTGQNTPYQQVGYK